MDNKYRAGISIICSLVNYLFLSQPLIVCFLLFSTIYFFIGSLDLKKKNRSEVLKPIDLYQSHLETKQPVNLLEESFCLEPGNLGSKQPAKVLEKSICTVPGNYEDAETSTINPIYIENSVNTEIIIRIPTETVNSIKSEAHMNPIHPKTIEKFEISTSTQLLLLEQGCSRENSSSTDLKMNEIQLSKVHTLSLEHWYTSYIPKKLIKRPISTQTTTQVSEKHSETLRIATKDLETQTWTVQEDQEVNTTQSISGPLLSIKQPRPRSNSYDVSRDNFIQEKEFIIGELVFERVINQKGLISFIYRSQIEPEFPISQDEFMSSVKSPFFISLINFCDKELGEENLEIFKEYFVSEDRFVKFRCNEFGRLGGEDYIDDPDFQLLYSSIYLSNLSDAFIVIVDDLNFSRVFESFFKYRLKMCQDVKPMFILHYSHNLEVVSQEFTIKLIKTLEINIQLKTHQIAFTDPLLKLFHLEAGKLQSYKFIEDQLQVKPARTSFNIQEHFKEKLEETLKFILEPDRQPEISSKCIIQDYGYLVSVKFKNTPQMPKSIISAQDPPMILKVSSVLISPVEICSSITFTPQVSLLKSKPLSALFISPFEISFEDMIGVSKHTDNFLEVYSKAPDHRNYFNDDIFNQLSSWVIGSQLSDFIVLIIDFSQMPDLHHSHLLLNYLSVVKDFDKPMYILHKTSDLVSYEYSFKRMSELLETTWASDRVLLHEEITDDLELNAKKLELIKDQMNDNLFDPDTHFDLSEIFKIAFENTVEKLLLIQNTRKRELLIKGYTTLAQDSITCKSDLENTWKTAIKEDFTKFRLKNLVYVSPAQYHIDKNISSTIYSVISPEMQDQMVKISVFSNLPPSKLSHMYLSDLAFCFEKNKEDTLLIFPSSRVLKTSISNHLNTAEFNSVFLHKFMERISDCLILSLFYKDSALLSPEDNFLGLSSMLQSRSRTKPMLILHHYYKEGDMPDYSKFFKQAIKDFDELLCDWTQAEISNDIRIHENNNQGIYAFDPSKQIIHRLIVNSSEIVWKWYNGVLYKIMHNAVMKNKITPLNEIVTQSFKDTIKEEIKIIDDDQEIDPVVHYTDYLEKSWKTLSNFSMTVYTELLPSWIITTN